MEFGKKIKGIFGSSKEQPMTVPEEKKQAASIRQETEKVKNALLALRLVDTTGTIPQEYLEEYKKIIRGLTARLDNAQVSLQDTKRIDRTLLFFVQKLDTAVKNGCRSIVAVLVLDLQFALVPHRAPGRRLDLDQVRSHFLSPCHFFDRAHLENGRRGAVKQGRERQALWSEILFPLLVFVQAHGPEIGHQAIPGALDGEHMQPVHLQPVQDDIQRNRLDEGDVLTPIL